MNGIILAGGRSSRIGTDKAFIKFAGVPIIERTLSLFKSLFVKCLIVTNKPNNYSYLNCPLVSDHYNNIGPLGGLHAGLFTSDSHLNFVVACDMPLIKPEVVKYITGIQGYDAVVPLINGFPEPLLAVYSRRCLPAIEKMIAEKEYKISRLYDRVKTKFLPEEEIGKLDPELESFSNLNTLKALEKHERKNKNNQV